ncbi:MAG TPA: VOC family protein [Candidatus Acidoferrum sp.]|nr:VOC family protein [Candidatus Acidoferrum sp.]
MNWKVPVLVVAFGVLCAGHSFSEDRPANRFHIYGLTRVEILSTNVPSARGFYEQSLHTRKDDCSLCDNLPVAPISLNARQALLISKAPAQIPTNFISEIIFSADNVRVLRRYLKENKIQIVEPAENENRAERYLSVIDPEGHRIGFTQNVGVPGSKPLVVHSTSLHLIHAGFIVHDRAATEHFYKDILGFRPYWHGGMKDDQTDWVSMQVPDGTDWLEFMVNVEPDADQKLRGIMNHIAIGVTDIHAEQKKLQDAGVKLTEEPQIGRDGKWQLNLYDPDLTRIEFMELTPVQKPCCSEFTGPHPGPQPSSKAPAKP